MTELAHNNRLPFLTRRRPDAPVALSGSLSVTPLLSLCSTLEANRKTALVRILTEDGPAHMWFRSGVLLDAEYDGAAGEGALCRILTLDDGRFEVLSTTVDRPRAISASPNAVAQRREARTSEWTDLLAQGPGLDTVLRPVEASEAHTPLLSSQLAVLPHVDGERTISEVIEEVGGDAIETLRDIVALVALGVLREGRPSHVGMVPPAHEPEATPIPKAPPLPQIDKALAPPPQPRSDSAAEEAESRYSSRPGTIEVVQVPDNVRPSSEPPPPDTLVLPTAGTGAECDFLTYQEKPATPSPRMQMQPKRRR
jgi:hypothetical protein